MKIKTDLKIKPTRKIGGIKYQTLHHGKDLFIGVGEETFINDLITFPLAKGYDLKRTEGNRKIDWYYTSFFLGVPK